MTSEEQRDGRFRRAALPLVGTVLAAGAWVLLVLAAIDFGERGRNGNAAAWVVLAITALGAVLCLVLALALGRQLLAAVGAVSEYQPKRARRSRRERA